MTIPMNHTTARSSSTSGRHDSALESGPCELQPSDPSPCRYEELDGGAGREIYFRPERYRFTDLGPVRPSVVLHVGHVDHLCELRDVSQSGVAFEWNRSMPLQVGDVIPKAIVTFDRQETYRGAGKISSIRSEATGQVVGMSFLDGLMNIDDVLELRDVRAWKGPTELDLDNRPWSIPGFEPFKSLVAEFRLFLIDAKQQLDALEQSLPWHVMHGEHPSLARTALVARLEGEVVRPTLAVSTNIDTALRAASSQQRQSLKDFSTRHLQDLLGFSPWLTRARNKPLGYPGDFETMNGLYGDHFAGSSLFAKALNLAVVSMPAAAAVRERKNAIKYELSKRLHGSGDTRRAFRVLSIAAGPAQEIFELLNERSDLPTRLEIVLFDQDKRALGFAHDRLRRLVDARWGDQVHLTYLHDSIKRLLSDEEIFSEFGAFDFIFSCGLFDYLQLRTASYLIRSFYSRLADGGTVYIGNMTPDNPSRWIMEHHLDWWLNYRERADLMGIARLAAPDASISILEEATGINPFVTLSRK